MRTGRAHQVRYVLCMLERIGGLTTCAVPIEMQQNPNVPTLIAPVPAIWFDYVKLEHFDGNVFKVSGLLSYVRTFHLHQTGRYRD